MDCQKAKLIRLLQFLQEHSDENHPRGAKEIQAHLEQFGISVERKTVYNDIAVLQDCGYDIQKLGGKGGGYYLAERAFTLPEVKMLLDLVQASPFLSSKKSLALIDKLERLMSEESAKSLHRQVRVISRLRTENEDVYAAVDVINSAINSGRKLTFTYFDWAIDGTRRYRKGGSRYAVNPVALCVDKYYYLITFEPEGGLYKHYRVDRMDALEVSDERRDALPADFDLGSYTRRVFSMFHGSMQQVRLRLHNSILNQTIDRFGADAFMHADDAEHFVLTAEVDVSSTFYAWVFQFGSKAEILSPVAVREEYVQFCREALEAHK